MMPLCVLPIHLSLNNRHICSVFLHRTQGMFVSESKFQANPAAFIPLIKSRDTPALEALITKPEVERALLARLRKKATLYARELGMDGEPLVVRTPPSPSPSLSPSLSPDDNDGRPVKKVYVNGDARHGDARRRYENENGDVGDRFWRHKFRIEVADVERLYEDWIIPLTKEVEVSPFFAFRYSLISWCWIEKLTRGSQVQYLLQRLDGLSEKEIEELMRH